MVDKRIASGLARVLEQGGDTEEERGAKEWALQGLLNLCHFGKGKKEVKALNIVPFLKTLRATGEFNIGKLTKKLLAQ